MFTALLLVLLGFLLLAFYAVHKRQQKQVAELKKSREKIQLEETRVFDFLHGLGEAFTEDIRPGDLHRLIVEGAGRILEAHGGALYLIGRQGAALLPSFVSKDCPPLIEIPQNILKQAETLPLALQSYIRLHSIEPGEGIVGTVWRDREPLFLSGD